MERRAYFLLGDTLSNATAGALAGLAGADLTGPGWNPFWAMVLGMLAGMLAACVVVLLVFFPLFGAVEVMLPSMLTGMVAGMAGGMIAAGVGTAAAVDAGLGNGTLVARMFEHTGSRLFPFSLMLDLMTPLPSPVSSAPT